jgi:hypothetical protein
VANSLLGPISLFVDNIPDGVPQLLDLCLTGMGVVSGPCGGNLVIQVSVGGSPVQNEVPVLVQLLWGVEAEELLEVVDLGVNGVVGIVPAGLSLQLLGRSHTSSLATEQLSFNV